MNNAGAIVMGCGMSHVMNLALSIIVFYITWQNRTLQHHKITMINNVSYTFTTFTLTVINIV